MTAQEVLEIALQSNLMGLTLKQPYAELMSYGKVETRKHNTKYRGWVLITSSAKPYTELEVRDIAGGKGALELSVMLDDTNVKLLNGHALMIGRLAATRLVDRFNDLTFCGKAYLSMYPYKAWIFEDLIEIEPFPVKGKLNLWDANSLKSQIQLKR